jgi:dinuclear metal center YbgI/SA1388 family protein
MKLKDIISRFEDRIPLAWQDSWDRSGLQVGDSEQPITRVLFAYDICKEVIRHAIKTKAQLIVSHHPFRLKADVVINTQSYEGKVIRDCLKNGIALYAAHTNHDASTESLNRTYLAKLGVQKIKPIVPAIVSLTKLAVMVPARHTQAVLSALFKAGAGGIGNYTECSFRSQGVGTFKGNDASKPAIGRKNRREHVTEDKVEVLVRAEHLKRVVDSLLLAHPYEEVAYDLVPLNNKRADIGSGAWGVHPKAFSTSELIKKLNALFNITSLRWVDGQKNRHQRIGICTGSGASLIPEAIRAKLDVFITGDIKYHQAIDAKRADLALADIGHFASEIASAPALQKIFQELFGKTLAISTYSGLKDPFEIR